MKKILLPISLICFALVGCTEKENNLKNQDINKESNIIDKYDIKDEVIQDNENVKELKYMDFGDFSIKIPTEFTKMNEDMLITKYPSVNRPEKVYTNEKGSVNIAFNREYIEVKDGDIKPAVESIEETFKLIGEDIKLDFYKVDYRQVGVMEVTTNAIDTKIYNKMIMFSLNGKFKTISFNCTEELKDEWLDTGDAIIKSLKFN